MFITRLWLYLRTSVQIWPVLPSSSVESHPSSVAQTRLSQAPVTYKRPSNEDAQSITDNYEHNLPNVRKDPAVFHGSNPMVFALHTLKRSFTALITPSSAMPQSFKK